MNTIILIGMAACVFLYSIILFLNTARHIKIERNLRSMDHLNDGFCIMLSEYLELIRRMERVRDDINRGEISGEEWKR